MDLFDYMRKNTIEQEAPLASRLRPSTLDEVVGQKHIIGKDKLLYRAIQADKLGSLIFYGPPGTGKTTLARVIAKNVMPTRRARVLSSSTRRWRGKKIWNRSCRMPRMRWGCTENARSCLSTRFTALIRGSRTIFCRLLRMVRFCSLARRRRIRILRSTGR